MRCLTVLLLLALFLLPHPTPAWEVNAVKAWASALGDELWDLNESLTKVAQIRQKYKQMNASVKQKDGKKILQSSLQSVSTMIKRKVNAVKCIHATAENLAKNFNYSILDDKKFSNFSYCSAKYSKFTNEIFPKDFNNDTIPDFAKNNPHYLDIDLERDSHFYDINVNTSISCVHVPTNIYYREKDPLGAILWSKGLHNVFIRNYQSDPSLSWQYFGSSHGILRFYPGMPWNRNGIDTYDCRVRSWYIEAATCSKDVIILFDVSGSMTGFKNYVARRTLDSILETLSNNDYVNVFTFKKDTKEVIDCFTGLVQATPENIQTIIRSLTPTNGGKEHKIRLEGNANLTSAYIKAFKTLKPRRSKCNVASPQGCNQMVMLITDYVPGNLTEVFEEYNREIVDNKTYIPVRVFTYLIGKEVTNVAEIQWMACSNRGYYVHIHSVEEVQQQVLKYINVIARPMILVEKEPPPTWTHANIDFTRTNNWKVSKDVSKPDEDKLVTSVAIPAFDYRHNEEFNDAILLGVAGTDVPIDSIAKLAQPHQLGVNGYSFIVSNNGYLLLHPLLITSLNDKLQDNYNSVDFVEVEQVDDGLGPRELGEVIKGLRKALVDGIDGSKRNIKVLYHYDDMRRIARVKHDYFYDKLEDTPFSMGISLPRGYGDTELLLKDNPLEVEQGQELTGINVTDYFRFSYRVHPDWVYCKYHYLEGHESDNAEIEIWKFLVNISRKEVDIKKKQYLEEIGSSTFNLETHCGNKTLLEKDDYYCNEDLVKQLVFDAKLTTPYFRQWESSISEMELAKAYNVNIRFIATSSGLTRWHYIFDDTKNEVVDDHGIRTKNYTGPVFGDKYYTAIEETWYKGAVLQHMINKESLVISTPLPILDENIKVRPPVMEDDDITITAAYAIFYKDGESETPASVVGFQFSYSSFKERFLQITQSHGSDKEIKCDLEGGDYNCYVVDSSGYIVLANDTDEVGQFFGVKNRYVLSSLVKKKVYDHVEVFNYQALCPSSCVKQTTSSSWSLTTPFNVATSFVRWLLAEFLLLMTNIYNQDEYAWAMSDDDYIDLLITKDSAEGITTTMPPETENITVPPEDELFSCDHTINLYILNQTYFLNTSGVSPVVFEDQEGDCHPPYWAAYIHKTNLLLVVVKNGSYDFHSDCEIPPDTKPVHTPNSTTSREPCHKLDLGGLHRRPLEGCYTYHERERNITTCGRGSMHRADLGISFVAPLLAILYYLWKHMY